MATVLAEVRRGGQVESQHYGAIAVSDVAGNLVATAGGPTLMTYLRSSAKPFQVLPIITSGAADTFAFSDAELAGVAASHNGEPVHQQVITHYQQ